MPSGKVIYQKYSEDDVLGAIAAVESGSMTYRKQLKSTKFQFLHYVTEWRNVFPFYHTKEVSYVFPVG